VILIGSFETGDHMQARRRRELFNVGGRPFLESLLDELARYQKFDEIILIVGDEAKTVEERYAGSMRGRSQISVIRVDPLGTAGALFQARDHLNRQFLLLAGDVFFDFNLLDLVARSSSSSVRLALRLDAPSGHRQKVELDGDLIVSIGRSYPQDAVPVTSDVCVMDRSILSHIKRLPASLDKDLFPDLAAQGALRGTVYHGYFIDMSLIEDSSRAARELCEKLRRPAVFFDRDGVLNHDFGYTFEVDKLEWIDGAREAVKAVNDAGYFAFVVTNQSGVARGRYDERHVHAFHRRMADEMACIGAHIDAFEYCPFHPEGTVERYRLVTNRRKPAPGMILELLERFSVDTDRSIVIGDKKSDLEAAQAAGLRGYLFSGGNLEDFVRQAMNCCAEQDQAR
jgi:D-glycero-D-manno-heptose 1,7-bisphosphate phosphatase